MPATSPLNEVKFTRGPFHWRRYANDAADIELMRKHGIEPIRMLTNDGQIALMAGTPDDPKRIALIDCQTHFKRGTGHKTDCAERDATANLFAAAPAMLVALIAAKVEIVASGNWNANDFGWRKACEQIDAAIALATEGSAQ